MLYRSAAGRRPAEGVRAALLAVTAMLAALVGGAATAVVGVLPLAAVAGLGGLAAVAFAPSYLVLGSLLILRAVTDRFANIGIVAGLNAGALIGLFLVAAALVLTWIRLRQNVAPALGAGLMLAGGAVFWFVVGIEEYGADQRIVRELVRTTSIVAVGVIAANADRSLTARRLADAVIIAAMIPAALVVVEGVGSWQQVVGGDLRPRGTLSHPNAASILFGVAIPMAAWRWGYDGGGRRYLLVAAFLAAAIVITKSMGGLAQVVVTLFVASVLLPGHGRARAFLGAGAVAIVVMFVADPFGISRVEEISAATAPGEIDRHDSSIEWRIVNWQMLVDEWRERPILGHGLGATDGIVAPLGHLPHSDPVRFLVETGAVGLGLLAVGFLYMMVRLHYLARVGPHPSFAAAVLAMLAGVAVHGLATHVTFNTLPIYVIAVLVGWTMAQQPGPLRAADAVEERSALPAARRRRLSTRSR